MRETPWKCIISPNLIIKSIMFLGLTGITRKKAVLKRTAFFYINNNIIISIMIYGLYSDVNYEFAFSNAAMNSTNFSTPSFGIAL